MPILRKTQDEEQERARAQGQGDNPLAAPMADRKKPDVAKPDVTDSRFRARPDLWRPPEAKPGQWRYDPEFARDINPHTFREKGGYGDKDRRRERK